MATNRPTESSITSNDSDSNRDLVPVRSRRRMQSESLNATPGPAPDLAVASTISPQTGWYNAANGNTAAPSSPADQLSSEAANSVAATEPPLVNQVTRPQGVERSRQIILEWSRPLAGAPASGEAALATAANEPRPSVYMDAAVDRGVLSR
jgi:hypothetical protein